MGDNEITHSTADHSPLKISTIMGFPVKSCDGNIFYFISRYGAYLFKAFPLDMSQFPGLFGATRIPQVGKDRIFRDPSSKHVLVQKNGHFYVFDVLDSDGQYQFYNS